MPSQETWVTSHFASRMLPGFKYYANVRHSGLLGGKWGSRDRKGKLGPGGK